MCMNTINCQVFNNFKKNFKTFFRPTKVPMHKQYSPILASNFEQKGQENTTSYNLQYCPFYHGRNVRVNMKQECSSEGNKHNLLFFTLE